MSTFFFGIIYRCIGSLRELLVLFEYVCQFGDRINRNINLRLQSIFNVLQSSRRMKTVAIWLQGGVSAASGACLLRLATDRRQLVRYQRPIDISKRRLGPRRIFQGGGCGAASVAVLGFGEVAGEGVGCFYLLPALHLLHLPILIQLAHLSLETASRQILLIKWRCRGLLQESTSGHNRGVG